MAHLLLRLSVLTIMSLLAASESTATPIRQEEGEFRKWTAANNKFSTTAKLLSWDDDSVKLESKDGKIFNVEVNKLCDADQKFIEGFLASEENPFTESAPPTGRKSDREMGDDDEVDDARFGTGFDKPTRKRRGSNSRNAPAVKLPKPGRLNFGRRSLKLNSGDYKVDISPAEKLTFDSESIDSMEPPVSDRYAFHNRMGSWAISVNEQFIASVVSNPFDKKAWVTVIDLASGNSSEPLELPWEEVKLLSVSPNGEQILTTNHSPQIPARTDLWKIADDKLEHVKGWKTRGFHDHDGIKFETAMIINDTKVLSTGTATALWDMKSGSDDFNFNAKSYARGSRLVLSPDRESFALVAAGKIHILNILTGEVEGVLERADGITNWQEMAFSPSGEFFAAKSGPQFVIWNLKNGTIEDQFPVLNSGGLAWIDDQYFLLGGAIHDVELRAVVWKYRFSSNKLVPLSDGRFLFVDNGGATVVELPHMDFDERIEKLDDDDLLVLGEGDTVGLDFSGVKEIDADTIANIKDTWTEKLVDLGVKVRSGADFDRVLRFKVHIGKTQEHEVRDMMDPFPFGGPFGRGRKSEEVKFAKKSASIDLVVDGKVIWRRSSHFGPNPIIMRLRDGETAQQHVDRTSKVNAKFFTSNFIPKGLRALPPELVGESKITRRGVE